MSGIEDLLRDAYQDAARTVQPERVRPTALPETAQPKTAQPKTARPQTRVGRPRRRFRALAPLAAAVAVVAAIALAVALPRVLAAGPALTPSAPAAPATPKFVVLIPYYANNASRLAVQIAGTRHVTTQVTAPAGTSWSSIAATGNDRTFVAAVTTGNVDNCSTAFYTLTLTAGGDLGALRPFRVPAVPGRLVSTTSLSASSDGRTISYASVPCPPDARPSTTIGVITDGMTRKYTLPAADLADLSLSADGRQLGYVLTSATPAAKGDNAGARILPTDARPGPVAGHARKVFSDHGGISARSFIFSPDGTTLYMVTYATTRTSRSDTLAAYRSADGTQIRTLHTWPNIVVDYFPEMALGGDQLLVWGIYQPGTYRYDLATDRLTPYWVFTPDGEFPAALAW